LLLVMTTKSTCGHMTMLIVCICLCLNEQCHVTTLHQSINKEPLTIHNPLIPIMHTLSPASQHHILSLLDAGHTAKSITVSTGHGIGTVSRLCSKHCPHLSKSLGGHPSKLSPANIHHAQCLINSGKAETAVNVTKILKTVTNQPPCTQTVP